MDDISVNDICKKISSDNYLINCYNFLFKSKAIHFLFILIEMLLNIFQEIDIYINGFNSTKKQFRFNLISYITYQFNKLSSILKLLMLLLLIILFDLLYYLLGKRKFKANYTIISIALNILELVYFRTIMIILLNLFYTLPNIYYLIVLLFLIPHIYLILNNFIYNHLYYFVPKFINYPFDEFTSIFDIIFLFEKIFLSIAGNTNNYSLGKFCFFLLISGQAYFCFFFIYKLINHSYLFMKNSFLNKTRLSFFFTNTIIIFVGILFGKKEILTILFLILCIGLLFIILAYMYLMYNPYHYIKISRETPMENLFFYLFVLSNNNDIDFLIENKINQHFEKCGICNLCKKYNQYLDINEEIEQDEEKENFIKEKKK